MTIAVDIRVLLDVRYSGVAEYTANLLRALLRADVVNDYIFFYNSFKSRAPVGDWLNAPNARLVGRHWPSKLLNYALFGALGRPRLDELIGERVDWCWLPHLNFMAWPRSRCLLTVHDLSFLRYPRFFSTRRNFWHTCLPLERLARQAESVVAISKHTGRDLEELLGLPENKIKIIYSGVSGDYRPLVGSEAESWRERYQLSGRFILSVSTLEPRKNLTGLVEAYNFLRQDYPSLSDVKLVFSGGDGWKFKEIYQAAAASPFARDIKFLGYVTKEDKPALYNAAAVLAFPSFYEGFGLPPLEAMACGTPVVASWASAMAEVVGEAGILIDPYDTRDLSQALAEVLSDSELADLLSQRGLAQAARFSWERAAREYLEIFNSLRIDR